MLITEDEPIKDSNIHHMLRTHPFKILLMIINTLLEALPVGTGN